MESVDKDLLRHIPLFARLPEDQLAELVGMLRPQRFAAQQPIFWIGDSGSDFYIVQVGRVTLSYPDSLGKEITLADVGPGHFFGEISLLDGGPRTATARAQTECILITLNRADFIRFLEQRPLAAVLHDTSPDGGAGDGGNAVRGGCAAAARPRDGGGNGRIWPPGQAARLRPSSRAPGSGPRRRWPCHAAWAFP